MAVFFTQVHHFLLLRLQSVFTEKNLGLEVNPGFDFDNKISGRPENISVESSSKRSKLEVMYLNIKNPGDQYSKVPSRTRDFRGAKNRPRFLRVTNFLSLF